MARVILHEYCGEARLLIEARAYDAAIAICRHILKRYPKHVETYRLLGEACLEKGDLNEAADVFKRLLSADPENFAAYAGLGVIYEERQQLAQAIWHMERAFELAPNNEEIRNALRRLYGQRDGAEPARIKLNKVALARLYSRGGQYRQAIEEFSRSLEAEPKRMDIRLSLAETLWRDARREQAAEVAREILKVSPDCLKAILLLGAIQIDKGHADEGQQILARARILDPENRLAQTLFGDSSPLSIQPVLVPRVLDQSVPIVASTEPTVCEDVASAELEAEQELIAVLSEETAQPETCSAEVAAAPTADAVPAAVPVAVVAEEPCPAPEALPLEHAQAETPTEAPTVPATEISNEATAVALEAVFPVQEAAPAPLASEASVAPEAPTLEAAPETPEAAEPAPTAEQTEALAAPALETAPEAPEAAVPAPVAEQTEALAASTMEAAPEAPEAVEPALVAEQTEALAAPALEASSEAAEVAEPAPAVEQAEVLAAPTLEAAPEALKEAEPTPVMESPEALTAPALETVPVQAAQPAIEAPEAPVATSLAEQLEAVPTLIPEAVSTPETQPASGVPEAPVAAALVKHAEELAPPAPEAMPAQEVQPVSEAPETTAAALPVGQTPAQEPQAAQSTPLVETVATEPISEPAAATDATPSGTPAAQEVAIPQSESAEASSQEPIESPGTAPEQGPAADELASTASSVVRALDVEHYEQQLQQNPKDERTRLGLARIYRDQEQVELALEQYRALARAKTDTLVDAIEDMESIVASRPGNLAAHELLADLYNKNGQLQKALERYRWLLQQVEQKPA